MPKIIVRPNYLSVEVTKEGVFVSAVSGVGHEQFNYQWVKGNTSIADGTGDVLALQDVNESHSGNYSCYVSNEFGDSAVSNVVVLQVTSKHSAYIVCLLKNII